MEFYKYLLYSTLVSSIAALSLPPGFAESSNQTNSNLSFIVQNSDSDSQCEPFRPKCVETGGICRRVQHIVYYKDGSYNYYDCYCPIGTEYENHIGCKVSDKLCKHWRPRCLETGGTCKKDALNAYLQCSCPVGTEYLKDAGCKDKCLSFKCQNGGRCGIKNGRAVCFCNGRFAGDFCNIDKCSLIKCPNGGKCDIKNGNAVCFCDERFEGDICNIDKCLYINCHNGGTCKIENGKATCSCPENYLGDYCEKNKCWNFECENGGNCHVRNGKAVCVCTDKYAGEFCETDKCSLMRCLNGGKCEVRNSQTKCVCYDGFAGEFCEIKLHRSEKGLSRKQKRKPDVTFSADGTL